MAITVPVTLRSNKKRTIYLFILSVSISLTAILLYSDHPVVAILGAFFFSLGALVSGIQLLPQASYLRLTKEGFVLCSLFRKHTYNWAEIEGFGITCIHNNRMVAWNFSTSYKGHPSMRQLSAALSGYEAALPETYGFTAEELTVILAGLHENYCKESTA